MTTAKETAAAKTAATAGLEEMTRRANELNDNPEKRDAMTPDERAAYIFGFDTVEAYKANCEEMERKTKEKNDAAAKLTLAERLDGRGFVSVPGDVLEIVITVSKHYSCLSNGVWVRLVNGDNMSECTLANKKETWQWLKKVSEIAGRRVDVVTMTCDDREYGDYVELERVEFKESAPYRCRFGRSA